MNVAAPEFGAGLPVMGTPPRTAEADAPGRIDGASGDPRTRRRVARRRLVRGLREKAAAEHIGTLPEPGEDVVLVMTGKYHGWDMLTACLDLAGCRCDELMVATLGFNRAQSEALAELMDADRVGAVTFVVSEMFRGKNGGELDHLRDTVESRGGTVGVNRNHAKLILIGLADGRRLVLRGSMNLRRCNSFEQIEISDDPALYDFFRAYIRDAIAGEITA